MELRIAKDQDDDLISSTAPKDEGFVDYRPIVYMIDGPKYWDREEARWIISPDPEKYRILPARTATGESNIEVLKEILAFYKLPMGELATPEEALEELYRDNKDYLMQVLILSALDLDIPEAALQRFAKIKETLAEVPGVTLTQFLRNAEKKD